MMRAAIAEQTEMTRLSLRFLQISANKSAVERIYEERNGEHARALEAWKKGKSRPARFVLFVHLTDSYS
jgi:hypothetical protein